MPRYRVKHLDNAWLVVDSTTGSVVTHFTSRSQARAHAKELNAAREEAQATAA